MSGMGKAGVSGVHGVEAGQDVTSRFAESNDCEEPMQMSVPR